MLKNYLLTAWRNLLRSKFYSTLNIFGLAIGLAVGIMVLLWVQDEWSYDTFHHNAATTYRVNTRLGSGTSEQVWATTPGPVAVFCKQSIPEVQNVVRTNNIYEQIRFTYGEKKFTETKLAFVDSNFFSLFDFKLLQGNLAKPFPNDNAILLTASTAKKYFGNNPAIGNVLVTEQGSFTVSGIMQDYPENSSLQYDMLLPMSLYAAEFKQSGGNGAWKTMDEDLGNFYFSTYVQVAKKTDAAVVAQKITSIYHSKRDDESISDAFTLQPLASLHLVAADGNSSALQKVRIFLVVALLILLIACINYVNLSTARAMLRSKEVSVRKIIGANRLQLFAQFIMESVVLFALASALAFLMIYLLLPLYNNISSKHLLFSLADRNIWLVIGSAVIGTLVLASIYPALLLSSFKPIEALKGKLALGIGTASFRKILVVTQFVFSVGLIIGTLVIGNQLKYIREKDLGFNKEHVFSFGMRPELHDHYAAVLNELLKQPGILGAASSTNSVVGVNSTTGDTYWEGKEEGRMFLIHPNRIDEKFIPLLKMQLVAGSNFTGSKADSAHYILNEAAVKQAGITDPVGKRFKLHETEGTIIGVVKDFNYASLKEKVEPYIFSYDEANWRIYVKTTGKDAAKAIAAAGRIWKNYSPEYSFEYSFLDEDYNALYKADQRTGLLFNVFAIVAIIISCLGLLGLATYTAHVKTKEIGIRKVLGASVANITNLLVREFITLVVVAFVIAAPLAWWLTHKWLQDFAYRISISGWIFILAGMATLLVTFLTIGFQAVRAAMANPVKSLRTE